MANLARWDPFGEFDRIDHTFNRMMRRAFSGRPRLGEDTTLQWSPSANISETDKEYLIRAELPAVKKEDVKVTVDGGMITIEGERKQQREERDEKHHQIESFYGKFSRGFTLPDDVNVDAIQCEDKDGILTVHMPKTGTHKATPKQITVQ